MSENSTSIIEAYRLIREGDFTGALEQAENALRLDENNFWGWYFAAAAHGFLNQKQPFQENLARAATLHQDSPFFHYLKAYSDLLEGDLEKALWEWTRIVDTEEGWLARNLIEKARNNEPLIEMAGKGDFAEFIVLPVFPSEMPTAKIPGGEKPTTNSRILRPKSGSLAKILVLSFTGLFVAVVFTYFLYTQNSPENEGPSMDAWKNLTIDESATIPMHRNADDSLYEYKERDSLITDFQLAKDNLSAGKVNQARFLLQRILYSNADFQSKERSRIFLNFIPEPEYKELNDPVSPEEILEHPEFYMDALIIWEGKVVSLKEVDRGQEIRLEIEDSDATYSVEVFFQTGEEQTNWKPYEDFKETEDNIEEQKTRAVIFGRYKGLLGKQKNIYIEAIQIWL
ncbi:MAG: hypothetical protein ABUK01_16560 [Leptospirales bacterium]